MTTRKRHMIPTSLALAASLLLTACGSGDDTASTEPASGMDHGGSSSSSSAPAEISGAAAVGNDADIAFLTGMRPHHEQAVQMSDMVLAADPPAPVAELAEQVKAAQAPEIEQIDQMLGDLGQPTDPHPMGDTMAEHGGMMSDADMADLMDATGTDAARIYLEGMIEHHKGAIAAAETQTADGEYEPARQLAQTIATDQAAEITKIEALLASL